MWKISNLKSYQMKNNEVSYQNFLYSRVDYIYPLRYIDVFNVYALCTSLWLYQLQSIDKFFLEFNSFPFLTHFSSTDVNIDFSPFHPFCLKTKIFYEFRWFTPVPLHPSRCIIYCIYLLCCRKNRSMNFGTIFFRWKFIKARSNVSKSLKQLWMGCVGILKVIHFNFFLKIYQLSCTESYYTSNKHYY